MSFGFGVLQLKVKNGQEKSCQGPCRTAKVGGLLQQKAWQAQELLQSCGRFLEENGEGYG